MGGGRRPPPKSSTQITPQMAPTTAPQTAPQTAAQTAPRQPQDSPLNPHLLKPYLSSFHELPAAQCFSSDLEPFGRYSLLKLLQNAARSTDSTKSAVWNSANGMPGIPGGAWVGSWRVSWGFLKVSKRFYIRKHSQNLSKIDPNQARKSSQIHGNPMKSIEIFWFSALFHMPNP